MMGKRADRGRSREETSSTIVESAPTETADSDKRSKSMVAVLTRIAELYLWDGHAN